jgi:uncharacterized protein with NRDE domain
MCLILVAWKAHAEFPLVVAANRDEFHTRPTEPAHEWEGMTAGRDLESGGTWLGVTPGGRFAAVTNYREDRPKGAGDLSRGALVTGFLQSETSPEVFLDSLDANRYGGFGLLVSDLQTFGYFSNRAEEVKVLEPGIYGLSNHLLDSEWPKVKRGKETLREILRSPEQMEDRLLDLLADRIGLPQRETAAFIVDPIHGTRSSTVALFGSDGRIRFVERAFSSTGETLYTRAFELLRSPVPSSARQW